MLILLNCLSKLTSLHFIMIPNLWIIGKVKVKSMCAEEHGSKLQLAGKWCSTYSEHMPLGKRLQARGEDLRAVRI
jgi:hypothetical protein